MVRKIVLSSNRNVAELTSHTRGRDSKLINPNIVAEWNDLRKLMELRNVRVTEYEAEA